ncbi:acyltransferase like protein [Zymoseptoria brevis]|uniref:Acyltransferase like protein n=1 Tax=Zymoseptoria brevis TaxID=1047168 RepID=A0A0F4GZH3_9PEZI|nr:acyltransferase like protein [Zymoseptoria brevis]
MDSTTNSPPPLRRTAYLDGLRGFGALLVYILHHIGATHMEEHQVLENAFGHQGRYYFGAFPFVRIFFTGGHIAVGLFYLISGYVLAAKPLNFIHSRDMAKFAENVGSALFRRWIRLFLPVFGLTFIWMTSWHLLNFLPTGDMVPEPTYLAELSKWFKDQKGFSYFWAGIALSYYSFHAWSIPYEFRGSVVVYTVLVAVAGLGTSARLRVQCVLIFYFLFLLDGWGSALFVCGMLLADMEMLHARNELPKFYARVLTQPKKTYYFLLLAGMYLGGAPAATDKLADFKASPGWYYLSFLVPGACSDPGWFFRFWGGTFIMLAIPRLPWLRSFFETRFCQYLGRISFGLYLVHGPVLWSVGDRVYASIGLQRWGQDKTIPQWINCFPLPRWGIFGIETNFLLAQLFLFPLTIYLAEIFTRLVDEPSVQFAQWLFRKHVEPKRDSVL